METFIQALVNGISLGSQYALLALGFSLVYGVLGIVNFAHGGFYILGGYFAFSAAEQWGLSYWFAVPIAVLAVAALGYVVERVLVEPIVDQHDSTLIMTVGLYLLILAAILQVYGPDSVGFDFPVSSVIRVGDIYMPTARLIILAASALTVFLLYLLMTRTRHGVALRALADNRTIARAQGFNPKFYFPMAMALTAGLAALAGALVTPVFDLGPVVGDSALMISFLAVVLGGLGSLIGAVIAALTIGLIEAFAGVYLGGSIAPLLLYVFILGVLVVRPAGFGGKVLRDA